MNDIYDTTEIRLRDEEMIMTLHNVARVMETRVMENADNIMGHEIRQIADRFNELAKAAHNRKHWTGHE